jgi:uncharacterized membrane protein YkvA (DUF1232 family)
LLRTLVIVLAAAAGVWILVIGILVLLGRKSAAREFAAFLPNLIGLFRGLAGDPRVSRRTKFLLLFGLVWLVSPIDLIPEFIPIAGPLDDAIVAVLILRYVLKRAGPEVVSEHWGGDRVVLERLLRLAGSHPPPSRPGSSEPAGC